MKRLGWTVDETLQEAGSGMSHPVKISGVTVRLVTKRGKAKDQAVGNCKGEITAPPTESK